MYNEKTLKDESKYSINSLVYWVTYVHNVVYSFYRSMIYCYINSTQRCAGSIVIDIIPTNGADKRKFFPFAPYFPVTNVIKRYFYPYFPAIIGIKGYSFRKRLLNYILCIRFFIEVHSIVSASRFFHMPTYLRVVIECQSRFFPFFPAFSRNCPDYFLHTSGSSSFRSLSDLGAR